MGKYFDWNYADKDKEPDHTGESIIIAAAGFSFAIIFLACALIGLAK